MPEPLTAPLRFDRFIDYHKVRIDVASDLNHLRAIARELELHEGAQQIASTLGRLEQDRFTVAVVGEFKVGKSMFLNAMLGADIVPVDVLPCSATLNKVTYGLEKRVELRFRDGRTETIGFDALHDWVTKLTPESEANAASIDEAVVYFPSPYCEDNVDVYDTPGLNDEDRMTEVTLSVLPKADAAVLVISALSPFGNFSRLFLEDHLLTADLGRVLFLVTQIDRLPSPADADRVIAAVERRIADHVIARAEREFGAGSPEFEVYRKKIGRPRVYGISAQQALLAKQGNDGSLLEQSRFPAFERALETFLTQGRGAIVLQVMINRCLAAAREILEALALRTAALGLKREEFEQAYQIAEREIAEVEARKQTEMVELRQASIAAERDIGAMADQVPQALVQAAVRAMDEATIARDDLADTRKLSERVGREVAAAVRIESDRQGEAIQAALERALAAEVSRLDEFSAMFTGLMSRIAESFGGREVSGLQRGTGELVAAVASFGLGVGGVWSGFREAGAKGAVVGGLAGFGFMVAGTTLVALVAAPLVLPAAIGLAVVSVLPGRWAARKIFPGERIERFRGEFKEQAVGELRTKLEQSDVRLIVREQVRQVFRGLRDEVERQADTALADAKQTLLTLRARYERDTAMTEAEAERLAGYRETSTAIGERAARLSRQLAELAELDQ